MGWNVLHNMPITFQKDQAWQVCITEPGSVWAHYNTSMAKYPLHWCTGSGNTKHSHSHLIDSGIDFCMRVPEIQTVHICFLFNGLCVLDVALQLSLNRWAWVCVLLLFCFPVPREKAWNFGWCWGQLLVFSTAALLTDGDLRSLSQNLFWKMSTKIMIDYIMMLWTHAITQLKSECRY